VALLNASRVRGLTAMLQITPQMRVLVAREPVDGRKGIDSLVRLCRDRLQDDPFSGCVFIFRSRSGTSIRVIVYDGSGFWLAQKRLSEGRFTAWPSGKGVAEPIEPHQAHILFAGGDPSVRCAPVWRSVRPLPDSGKKLEDSSAKRLQRRPL
jgi:transposase